MIGENGIDTVSWFIGYVEDNSDRNGRVRVRAFGFHPPASEGTVATEDLPWAHVVRVSKVITPFGTDDLVFGFFMDGRDAQHPVVIGTINSAKFSSPAGRSTSPDATTGSIANKGGVIPTGGTVTIEEAYGLARQAGFSDSEARTMAAIAVAESGLNSEAFNGNVNTGDTSYGLWQINMIGNLGVERRAQFGLSANEQLYDPLTNARAAYEIYKQQGFSAWSVYKNGSYAQYLDQVQGIGGPNSSLSQFENPYLAPSQDAVSNFGNPALPPQITGENIEQTAAVVQAATRRSVSFTNGYTSEEPAAPTVGHVTDTAVWHTRYGGSNITLSGKNGANEYIDINHASGSRVTLDGNGNITIKAMGRVYIGSEGDIEESSEGLKIAHHMGGYAMEITGGKLQIMSAGDVEISTGGNLTLNSGGKMTLNAGDSIDIAGSRVAATARVDAINFTSAGKLALHSQSVGLSLSSAEALFMESKDKLNIKSGDAILLSGAGEIGLGSSGGKVVASGTQIHLNSDAPSSAAGALTAVAANVPDAIPLSVVGESKPKPTPSDISASMTDDTGPQ